MADAEEIARDMVVALFSDSGISLDRLFDTDNPTTAGETVGRVYAAVLRAVEEGATSRVPPRTLPPSGPAGGELSGTYPNPVIANGVLTARKFGSLPAVSANRSETDQLVADGVDTPVVYNSQEYDTAGIHPDNVNGDSRFTAPLDGLYSVHASVKWSINSSGERELRIRKNGGGNLISQEINPGVGHSTTHFISTIVSLQATDFVEAMAKQTSGGDLEILLGVGTKFHMYWVGPDPS